MARTPVSYLALLRGINVGGSNVIRMTDLREAFVQMGFQNLATYIQSGNVLFKSDESSQANVSSRIEKGLSKRFGTPIRVVLVTAKQLLKIVESAPKGFGKSPDRLRYDVIFLKAPMTPKEVMRTVTTKEGVDAVHTGPGVLYFSRLIAKASQSRLPRIIQSPAYQFMTIRNWNTTTRLLEMMQAR